jgi:hypothetical protein
MARLPSPTLLSSQRTCASWTLFLSWSKWTAPTFATTFLLCLFLMDLLKTLFCTPHFQFVCYLRFFSLSPPLSLRFSCSINPSLTGPETIFCDTAGFSQVRLFLHLSLPLFSGPSLILVLICRFIFLGYRFVVRLRRAEPSRQRNGFDFVPECRHHSFCIRLSWHRFPEND